MRLGILLGLAGVCGWWFWPETAPQTVAAQVDVRPPAQATQSGQAWPFGTEAVPVVAAAKADVSPWERLSKTAEREEAPGPDPRTLNAAIPPTRLSLSQPQKAQAFLDHVVLQPEQRGGFVVASVLPGSRYARAGLLPGDTVYSLDVPGEPVIDESNMVAMTSVQVLAFEVVRRGVPIRLSTRLDTEESDHANTATP